MIRVEHLSKTYKMYRRPLDRLWDWVTPPRWHRGAPFGALQDVSFEVPGGSSMGIVGVNGAGKSTLLKILTGTTAPTSGRFEVEGRVASLLELGTGFHPEFTGRANIFFAGKLAGLDEAELVEKYDSIVEFSELGAFIDQPVRTYSSGMQLRLGFALASSVEPDVLIVDEALSVGDLHFQQKCLGRIRRFVERGTTVLLVSHDPSVVKTFCRSALLLDGGRLIERGAPDHVLDYYTALLAEKYREGGRRASIVRPDPDAGTTDPDANGDETSWDAPPLAARGHRTGNFKALVTSVWMHAQAARHNPRVLATGSAATFHVRWVAFENLAPVTVGILIKDRLGQEIFGVNTAFRETRTEDVAPGQTVETVFDTTLNLGPGQYSLTVALHHGETHTERCYDWVEGALALEVLPNPTERFSGLCRLPVEIATHTAPTPDAELDFARRTREDLLARASAEA